MIASRTAVIFQTIRDNFLKLFIISLVFTIVYYSILMLSLIIRFQDFPNYMNFHDWGSNVIRIFESTPSIKDSLFIFKDEWLMEIGFMNYDFGAGISEWSLFLAPVKMLGVFCLGLLLAINYLLLKNNAKSCSVARLRSTNATAGFGAVLVSLASITMSWVVCCSTPTWVVGLAMMGLGVSTSLWLEPLGLAVSLLGFGFLIVAIFIAAGNSANKDKIIFS